MDEPVVVHVRDKCYFYIGRPSALGNPFVVGMHGSRDAVIKLFEEHARGNPALLAAIRAIPAGARLGCHCKPLACHGDVIVKIWKEMHKS
jgi:hypothetical protein